MAEKQQTPPFGVRMPDDLKEWIKETAQKEGRSQNNLVVRLLQGAREAAGGDLAGQTPAATTNQNEQEASSGHE